MSDTYKIIYSKVIIQAIKDMVCSHQNDREAAIKYLKSNAFLRHCEMAGFPAGLQDALDEMLLLSRAQQTVVVQMVMDELLQCA